MRLQNSCALYNIYKEIRNHKTYLTKMAGMHAAIPIMAYSPWQTYVAHELRDDSVRMQCPAVDSLTYVSSKLYYSTDAPVMHA